MAKSKKFSRKTTVRVSLETHERLRLLSKLSHASMAKIVRAGIEDILDGLEPKIIQWVKDKVRRELRRRETKMSQEM